MTEFDIQWQVSIREVGKDDILPHFGVGTTPTEAVENAVKYMNDQLEAIQTRRQILRSIQEEK